jgi:hypothetical protein
MNQKRHQNLRLEVMILLDSKRKEKFADLGKEGDVLKISFYFFFFFPVLDLNSVFCVC